MSLFKLTAKRRVQVAFRQCLEKGMTINVAPRNNPYSISLSNPEIRDIIVQQLKTQYGIDASKCKGICDAVNFDVEKIS